MVRPNEAREPETIHLARHVDVCDYSRERASLRDAPKRLVCRACFFRLKTGSLYNVAHVEADKRFIIHDHDAEGSRALHEVEKQ